MSDVRLDPTVADLLLRYARLVVARGYVHNSLGNIAIRVPHPDQLKLGASKAPRPQTLGTAPAKPWRSSIPRQVP
ncbi:MAG: hypothetical protein HYR51_19420 [Candidatus Rokubacteria bacterium]|nr:hypothetical protein [Candidatus Rokubacteria bacterium]